MTENSNVRVLVADDDGELLLARLPAPRGTVALANRATARGTVAIVRLPFAGPRT